MPRQAIIIWDIDGTLLQTDLVTVPAVQHGFAAHGLPPPEAAAVRAFFGRSVAAYEAWLASLLPPGDAPRIIEAINRLELELIGEEGRLYPGARAALETLRTAGHLLAVCSNGPEDYVQRVLDAHELRPFFAAVRARGARRDGKTRLVAEIQAEMLAESPVGGPLIVVGDRADDVAAAHQNGGLAIGAAYGFGAPEELRDADVIVRAASEIPRTVARLVV